MYTPDQVEAAAKLLRFDDPSSGDRTYAADILDAYAATLKAAQGGVTEGMVFASLLHEAKRLRDEFAGLPHSLGYEYTHLPSINAAITAAEAALSAEPAAQGAEGFYVEARQCDNCDHLGLNDASETEAACSRCLWHGPEPLEDKCPGCGSEDCMYAACPECGNRYSFLADRRFPTPAAPPAQPAEPAHGSDGDDSYETSINPTVRAAYADGYDVGYAHGRAAQPAERVPENCLPFTHAVIDKMQGVMAMHGFAVPVRVVSDAFNTTRFALFNAKPSAPSASPAPSEGGKGVEG